MKRGDRSAQVGAVVLGCALVVGSVFVPGAPAGAQAGAPAGAQAGAAEKATVAREAIQVAVNLGQITERLLAVERDLVETQTRETQARVALDVIVEELAALQSRLVDLEAQLEARAAAAYVRSGSTPLAPPKIVNERDLVSGTRYANAAAAVDNAQIATVNKLRAELEDERQRREKVRADLERTSTHLLGARADLELLRLQAQAELERWGAVSVVGQSILTPQQIAAWYESTEIKPNLPAGLTIAEIARLFVEEGALHGVKGDIAFAQSIIETGSFTEYKGYNFSGIGVCDSCTGGYLFEGARDGVRAQIQLLRSYADPTSRASNLPVPLSPVLYSTDPVESARRFDTFFLKGAAPVWNEMGGGNWATDPLYSGKVLRVFARMLAFAAQR